MVGITLKHMQQWHRGAEIREQPRNEVDYSRASVLVIGEKKEQQ